MKKISLYLSDIINTINGNISNTEEDYQKLMDLLYQIKKLDNVDSVAFSLISSDNHDFVMSVKDIISKFSKDFIIFGRQFFDLGYDYHDTITKQDKALGKVHQIVEYIDALNDFYQIESIYYADDIELYQEMLSVIAEDKSWLSKLTLITPTEGLGLSETNILLENAIKEKHQKKTI